MITQNHPNAIALCCTPDWLPYAAATLLSCVQQGASSCADLYVVVLAPDGKHLADFKAFEDLNGFSTRIISAKLPRALAEFKTARFSPAAMLRVMLDQLLPTSYQRVLYLDCDILATGPVASIFEADLGGKSLGAVEDYQSLPGLFGFKTSHVEAIGLNKGAPYFNSGVLLFDWQRTQKLKRLQSAIAQVTQMQNQGKSFALPDQDVLNIEFSGDWKRLDLRFNLMAFFADYFPAKPVFRHFSNKQKPWGKFWQPGFSSYRKFYRRVFSTSPWPDYSPGRYRGISLEGAGGIVLRKLDPFSGQRFRRHLERP